VFQPLPGLLTEQDAISPSPSRCTALTRLRTLADLSTRSPVAPGQKNQALKKKFRSKEHKWKQRAGDLPIGGRREEQGCRTAAAFKAADKTEKDAFDRKSATRWETDVSLFSTMEELWKESL
jgi:hypothetical protein